ncbi:TM2 domain-containing protein 3-like [Oopsacas minuta]|uniref:TM2 domain-containing protein 3-like n=1 Tax=Oopsacas minuta TaxID=111878 RepID=A0AAV7JTK4_9METZ|nr:TM2 domain-containing protein 3-like [Oopsacas minuta]
MHLSILFIILSLSLPVVVSKQCEYITDCTGVPIHNESIYVRCYDGQCQCKTDDYCFQYTPDSDYPCTILKVCNEYSHTTDTCTNPNGYDWRTAFILSLLLSGTGAANFYINRYELAVPQLFLLTLAFVLQVTIICIRLWARKKKVDEDGFLCVMCCSAMILTIILLVIVLTSVTWWIVDTVLIYLNQRLDGNGCHLSKSS